VQFGLLCRGTPRYPTKELRTLLMQRTLRTNWPVTLSLLLLWSTLVALGKDAQRFTGFYQAHGSSAQGASITVTLSVRIFNPTDAPITGGSLLLRESLPPHSKLGSLNNVSVPGRGSVLVAGKFNVPRVEFESWQRGGSPDLTFEFQSSNGKPLSQKVDLKRGHVGNEG
jgi:hypothetical protein